MKPGPADRDAGRSAFGGHKSKTFASTKTVYLAFNVFFEPERSLGKEPLASLQWTGSIVLRRTQDLCRVLLFSKNSDG